MILDLNTFIKEGQVVWTQLESVLDRLNNDPDLKFDIHQVERFHYLYQRASADLARLTDFFPDHEIRRYLESLVGRSFSAIHENSRRPRRFNLFQWLFKEFPQTFRKNITAFYLALAIFILGSAFGGTLTAIDPESKDALMPFSHLSQDPSSRVAKEESLKKDEMAGKKSSFASYLISNNTRVSILALSLGVTWGIGTILILFSNGVYFGAVVADYMAAGQSHFMLGWLLPHGSIELPAIILAGQAGFVLGSAVIGWGKPITLTSRLRKVSKDLFTLMGGVALMLLWAGFVEAFLSQYHQPFISYNLKIGVGLIQLCLLTAFLGFGGRQSRQTA